MNFKAIGLVLLSLTCTLNQVTLPTRDSIQNTFNQFDENGDGKLSS
jgi:Ca2+-binding EF-hand superfamily protein